MGGGFHRNTHEHEDAVREAFTLLAEHEAEELKAEAEKTEEGRGRRRL